jgi:ATP-dependent RNA helicase DDX3X
MADGLQMGNLSINDSQHAPQGGNPPQGQGRAAYIPPHLRNSQRSMGAGAANVDGSAPPPGPGYGGPRYCAPIFHLCEIFR